MPLIEIGRWTVAVVFTALVAWASISDIKDRKIPNRCVLAIMALFVPWAVLSTGPWVLWALAAGAIALAIGVGLYALGMVGAGDAKMFAAVALFTGLDHLPLLGLLTALAGGAIALANMAAQPTRALVMLKMRGKGDFGRGIPYGVAIALAAAALVWSALLRLPLTAAAL